jgi:hypothetical protein
MDRAVSDAGSDRSEQRICGAHSVDMIGSFGPIVSGTLRLYLAVVELMS